MFDLGVKGYISKSSSTNDLIDGIKTIFAGNIFTSPDITKLLQQNETNNLEKIKLSIKDLNVIQLISAGFSNKEIADKENVTLKSIECRKTNIFKKLNVKNSPEMINFVLKNGLLQE